MSRADGPRTALLSGHSISEMSEGGLLAARSPPGQLARFRRSSHYAGDSHDIDAKRQSTWSDLMKEAESLDTDQLINVVSIETRRLNDLGGAAAASRPLIRQSKQRGLIKWLFNGLIGVVVGVVAFCIERSIEEITEHRILWVQSLLDASLGGTDHPLCSSSQNNMSFECLWRYLPAFAAHYGLAVSFVLTTVLLLVNFGPAASGSGVSLVMAYLNGLHIPKLLSAKTLGCKILGTVLTVSSGLPLGPEGPLVHIGAGVASFFTRQHTIRVWGRVLCSSGNVRLGCGDISMFNNDSDRREFISSGAAVGLAAAFGAPIGGVLYALEETSSFWSQRVTWRALLCTTLGTFSLGLFHGNFVKLGPAGLLSFAGLPNAYYLWELIPFIIVALCGGSFGALLVATYKRSERLRRQSKAGKTLEALVVVTVVSVVSFFVPMWFGQCLPKPEASCNIDCSACNLTTCEDSAVGRCVWDQDIAKDHKKDPLNPKYFSPCIGPNDELTLLQANCPNNTYNDLATLFLSHREGVISKLMRMKVAPGTDCDIKKPEGFVPDLQFSEPSLVLFLLLNFCCILLSFGISVPSGLFMPSIMTGATFGALLGTQMRHIVVALWREDICDEYFESHVQPGLYALVGAAAMLAGVFRSSISLAVILLEGTGQIQFLLPILLTIGVAKITADLFVDGLNEVQLDLKKMPFLHREPSHSMAVMTAADAMTPNVKMFRSVEQASVIADTIEHCKHNGFPVCVVDRDQNGRQRWLFEGMILRSQLLVILSRRALVDGVPVAPSRGVGAASAGEPIGTGGSLSPATQTLQSGGGAGEEEHDRRQGTLEMRVAPPPAADVGRGRLHSLDDLEMMSHIDFAMREYHHRHNFYSRSVSAGGEKVRHIGLSDSDGRLFADLSPYINLAPLAVRDCCPLSRVFTHFRTMGLRHAVVVDRNNEVVGIITRKDLARLQSHHGLPHVPLDAEVRHGSE